MFQYISPLENLKKETKEAAGFDICIDRELTIKAKTSENINSGLRVSMPKGYVGIVKGRSGLAFKHDICPDNTGVIDSDYRGDICIKMRNYSSKDYTFVKGERVAQLLILSVPNVEFNKVKVFEEKNKHVGFGSTGKI